MVSFPLGKEGVKKKSGPVRYHFTPIQMRCMSIPACGEIRALVHCCFGKQYSNFAKELKIGIPYDPASSSTLADIPKGIGGRNSNTYVYTHVPHSTIHGSHKVNITQMATVA